VPSRILPAGTLVFVRLIFDPEVGGDALLRNVGSYTDHTALCPTDIIFRNFRCENLKTYSLICSQIDN
jgi:hypothetical protein